MDEDKRQIRLFKEMYLADGELQNKDLRKKQFRWKNTNGKKLFNFNRTCLIILFTESNYSHVSIIKY